MVRNKIIPAVFLILEKPDTILLLERSNTGWNDGKYTLPSGHVERGESPREAIIREAFEEVGVRVEECYLELKTVLYRKIKDNEERIDFVFRATKWQGEAVNNEPSKASNIIWSDKANLPANTIDFIRNVIISDVDYIEIGYS